MNPLLYLTPLKASGPVTPYDPATDPNAQGVWEADSGVSLSGGAVTAWVDRTSNARSAAQSSGSAQPSLVTAQLKGLPIIRYSSSSAQHLDIAGNVLNASTTPFGVYFIIKPNAANVTNYNNSWALSFPDVTSNSILFAYNATVADGGYFGNPYWGGGAPDWNAGGFSYGPAISPGAFVYNTSTFQVWSLTYNGSGLGTATNFALGQAGTSLGGQTNLGGLSAINLNCIGSNNGGGAPAFDLAAFYVFNTPLAGGELANFNSYITNKWGI